MRSIWTNWPLWTSTMSPLINFTHLYLMAISVGHSLKKWCLLRSVNLFITRKLIKLKLPFNLLSEGCCESPICCLHMYQLILEPMPHNRFHIWKKLWPRYALVALWHMCMSNDPFCESRWFMIISNCLWQKITFILRLCKNMLVLGAIWISYILICCPGFPIAPNTNIISTGAIHTDWIKEIGRTLCALSSHPISVWSQFSDVSSDSSRNLWISGSFGWVNFKTSDVALDNNLPGRTSLSFLSIDVVGTIFPLLTGEFRYFHTKAIFNTSHSLYVHLRIMKVHKIDICEHSEAKTQ